MRFTKMHGCGNDYVVVDATAGDLAQRFAEGAPQEIAALARAVNDRHFGVGADGFVLILKESRADSPAHFEMRMHNPDGSYSAMCGNALRCVAKRLADEGRAEGDTLSIRSGETIVPMRATARDAAGKVVAVEADLGPPRLAPAEVPATLPPGPEGDLRAATLSVAGRTVEASVLSMGNPHCVLFLDMLGGPPLQEQPVAALGRAVETHAAFPQRTNVEFVEVVSRNLLRQRTWERGAGETLACGSGACAAAVAGVLTGRCERQVRVELRGGALDLAWREADAHVLMTGPATEVFAGDFFDETPPARAC